MHVLHVGKFYPPEYHGGLETAVVALCSGLVARGVEVSCAVAAVGGPTRAERLEGVRVVRARSYGVVLSQPLAPGLLRTVQGTPCELVHLHHPNPLGDLAVLAAPRRPLIVTQHSDVVRQWAWRPLYWPVVRWTLRRARYVVVSSPNMLGVSREIRGLESKVRVIPYGIDASPFQDSPALASRAAALRGAWGDGPVVLAVGRLVGYKGLPFLLEASRGLQSTVVIVGTGPEEARLRAIPAGRVVFAGAVSDEELPAYYRAADVFCLPSVSVAEAFGIVQLEAMASGLPLVTTSLPTGVTTVNRDGRTGLVVPPGDAGALHEALVALLSDAGRRRQMGEEGRVVVRSEFSAAVMVDRYLSLYREAV